MDGTCFLPTHSPTQLTPGSFTHGSPNKRPTIKQIKAHPFFEGINWDTILSEQGPFIPKPEDSEDTTYFSRMSALICASRELKALLHCFVSPASPSIARVHTKCKCATRPFHI